MICLKKYLFKSKFAHKLVLVFSVATLYSVYCVGMNGTGGNMLNPNMAPFFIGGGNNKDYQDCNTLAKTLQRSMEIGFRKSVENTVYTTSSNSLSFIPGAIKRLGSFMAAFLYKVSYGSNGLTWNILALLNNRIKDTISPFINRSYANNDRTKRLTEINQEMNNEFTDPNWTAQQTKIIKEIDHAIATLTKALPCYSMAFHRAQGGLKKILAGWVHALSMQNNDQVSHYIVTTITDLSELKKYFESFKSFKEAEQHLDHIRRWLIWICHSFQTTAYFIEGDNAPQARQSNSGRIPFEKVTGGSIASTQHQMNDLFGGPGAGSLNI